MKKNQQRIHLLLHVNVMEVVLMCISIALNNGLIVEVIKKNQEIQFHINGKSILFNIFNRLECEVC